MTTAAIHRRVLERLTRSWVFPRRLPASVGSAVVYVSPVSGGLRVLKPRLRDADPFLFRLVEELVTPGCSVWDVGANVGLFAFAAAGRAGPGGFVLAMEPDLDNVALLQRSREHLDRRRAARVEILAAAAFDGPQRLLEFAIASRSRASNALAGFGHSQMGGVRETRLVPALTLDAVLASARPPDVLKIDVEGAEAHAIAGARDLLARVRPKLLLEVSAGESAPAVAEALKSLGYRLFDATAPAGRRTEIALPSWNTLALPNADGA